MTNATGSSTAPPVVFRYSESILHPGGFQPESQVNSVLRFAPPLSIGGGTAPQSYGMATPVFLGRPPGNIGYVALVPPVVLYPTEPIPPPLNQDVLGNMIERMYEP